ncbi:MAG: type III-B CRISPR module-associated Cmr3 family protein, partial [Ostreibacterium sp.]
YDFFSLTEKVIHCDLGECRLAELKNRGDTGRDQVIENAYLSTTDFEKVLSGKPPSKIIQHSALLERDSRLGIARDNQKRRAKDGMLYQTKHIRLKENWCIYMELDGLSDDTYWSKDTLLRLGGEARMAYLSNTTKPLLPESQKAKETTNILVIYLLTPLPDIRHNRNLPPLPNNSFEIASRVSPTEWQGKINETNISIISAITGKPERLGGWDMLKHQSLPVRSFIPAGSCWYIRVENKPHADEIIAALHGQFLTTGSDRALGYGQIMVGLAPL